MPVPAAATALPQDADEVLKLAARSMFDVFAHAAQGMLVVDKHHRIVWISEGYKRFLPALGFSDEHDFIDPVNEWLVANRYKQYKAPPDFFTAGGMTAGIAIVEALKKTAGDASANKLIATMEGLRFDSPRGPMTFRKQDHQAPQSMYHFKIKVDPAFPWGVPELVREIKAEEMDVPVRNTR